MCALPFIIIYCKLFLTFSRVNRKVLSLKMLEAGIDSAKELAAVSGVSVNTISRSNNGGSMKLATLRRLAAALNCKPADLLEEN